MKKKDISFQKFKEYRYSLLTEDFQKYDSPLGLRGKLEELQEFLNDPKNIEKLDAYFIQITSKNMELELKDVVTSLVDRLKNITKEK